MNNSSDFQSDLDLALRMADAADLISEARFRSLDLEIKQKPDRTPVTDADRAVETAIRELITAERPDDSILGEEFGSEGTASRQWIIDPIDGTAHYLRGVPVWGTLIALAIDGVPVVGVVSSPALGRRWWGARGAGAWTTNGAGTEAKQMKVSGVTDLADATISYNSIQGWDKADKLEALIELSRATWRARSYGDMWSYMMLAEGLIDVVAEFDLQPYDMAALVPIVEEAGGVFTSVTGEPGPWSGNALASNGLLHAATRSIIEK